MDWREYITEQAPERGPSLSLAETLKLMDNRPGATEPSIKRTRGKLTETDKAFFRRMYPTCPLPALAAAMGVSAYVLSSLRRKEGLLKGHSTTTVDDFRMLEKEWKEFCIPLPDTSLGSL